MLFNSIDFLIFGALFFTFYPLLKNNRNPRFGFIIFASFIFYGWWDWRFLSLIVTSGFIDFFAGYNLFKHPERKKLFLAFSLLGNLGILFSFKYFSFFAGNLETLVVQLTGRQLDLIGQVPDFFRILPIGISFYTFQSLSYTIDIYRGRLEPTRNPLLFFAYLSMFPQLVAGPIVRAGDILKQLDEPNPVDGEARFEGLRKIARGFFKKVVIADSLAPFVDAAFSGNVPDHGGIYWWFAVTAFAIQIYCDFSGYSDIAIGLARWMGLDFKENFIHPYIAGSLREFWTRWHISLSTWFRDYVYIPLGGSRVSGFRGQINLWITMLVSGLWHGASWNFVAWGAVHALFLSLERGLSRVGLGGTGSIVLLIRTSLTLLFVWVAWVFFRTADLGQALEMLTAMFDVTGFSLGELKALPKRALLPMMLLILREAYVFCEVKLNWDTRPLDRPMFNAFSTALLLAICVFVRGSGNAFIYFQF